MTRALLAFLLVLLPLQFSYAAVGEYCRHEQAAGGSSHFGHHVHRHQAGAGTQDTERRSGLGGSHSDCAQCHFSVMTFALCSEQPVALEPGSVLALYRPRSIPPVYPHRLYRPPQVRLA